MSDKMRIAKNTMFLYIRMILIMGVSLYTSRVVLDKLGVDDYGLYNVVGGVVGMLSFLNGTLSTGTSRFLTFELGTGNKEKLKATFSTAFYVHLILSGIIFFLMETGGLYFFFNKLVIPESRLTPCFWVFQLSILTTMICITQVPYTSVIMAHEKMYVYAYISIFEAVSKLIICYMLSVSVVDKLILYAILITIVQSFVAISFRIYCVRNFDESKLHLILDKDILKSLMGFSGWNIIANLTETLKLQGVVILINLFFQPVVVASQAIANQVAATMMQFVNNFRTAINPQIIKLYAVGDKTASKKLTLETTVYCFDLILLLGLPAIYVMKPLMSIWLVDVPEYAVVFTQWIIACNIIGTFSASFYVPMMAANKIMFNSFASIFLGIGHFVLLYFILKFGGGPMWIQYITFFMYLGFSLFVKPYVLYKDIDYSIKELLMCYWNCSKVLFLSLILSLPFKYILEDTLAHSSLLVFCSVIAVCLSSYVFMTKQEKTKIVSLIKNKLHIKYN